MGAGFVLIIWLFIAALVSAILGIPGLIIAHLCIRKKQLSNKQSIYILSYISPLIFILAEMFLGVIGDMIVFERHNVHYTYGDYWEAPINDDYRLVAVDDSDHADIEPYKGKNGTKIPDMFIIKYLWRNNDTTFVLSANQEKEYSLYTFYPHSSNVDTVLYNSEESQLDSLLNSINLSYESARDPNNYFCDAANEAHKIEGPIRHILSLLVLAFCWYILIKRERKAKPN